MKQIGNWFVGTLDGGKKRAFCRAASGECFSVIQPVGGGAFAVVRFACAEEVFKSLIEAGGDLNDPAFSSIEIQDAMQVPDGLVDALLA